jgi:hypothetical protein
LSASLNIVLSRRLAYATLTTLFILQFLQLEDFFLGGISLKGPWIDDDPANLLVARSSGILEILTSPLFWQKFGNGRAFNPLQALMYRFDVAVGSGPLFSYLHSAVAVLACLFGLNFLLEKNSDRTTALLGSITWLFLPSTLVLLEFASARHYAWALFFAVLGAALLFKDAGQQIKSGRYCLACACVFVAILFKEAVGACALPLLVRTPSRHRSLIFVPLLLLCSYMV